MTLIHLTKHAQIRIRQRGVRQHDLAFVLQHGTESAGGIFFSDDDAELVEAESRSNIRRAQRLRNLFVATEGSVIKTALRATKSQQRRLLQKQLKNR